MDPLNESTSRGDDTETDPDERIGQIVDGRYKILQAMASGSMGAVYKAERIPVGKLVAVKFLHASYAKDSEFLARFERETRVMSKLAHPNCVSVVDFGVWDGAPYLVMEYVAGTTLRALLDEGPLAPERALKLAKQIAAALAHAHSHGVVHRDVKPANIMISQELGTGDHVRILDFGLARLRGNVGRDATQANVVVGTPNYMAPEQTIGGGTIDARTDIYACGVVLFEMVAGVRPFAADDTMQLLGMHRGAPVPQLTEKMLIPVPLPVGLQDLIEQAMAKAPDDRFQTALELTDAIDALHAYQSRPIVVDPAAVASTLLDVRSTRVAGASEPDLPARKGPRASMLGFLIILLAGAAVAVWYMRMRPEAATQKKDAGAVVIDPGPPPIDAAAPSTAPAIDAALAAAVVPDAEEPIATFDAAEPIVAALDAAIDAEDIAAGSGSGSGAGSGSGDEIEMDPGAATNPDPEADKQIAEDEAPDAPETAAAAEAREPAPSQPVLATTVAASIQLIKDGKRGLALASLNALWKKSPKSSYIPFLLGNLYFDRLWWAVAMDHYKAAISRNGGYRGNAVLNRNLIKMLASPKTVKKASGFIRSTIGKPAIPYLKQAAKSAPNDRVRKTAGSLAKSIR